MNNKSPPKLHSPSEKLSKPNSNSPPVVSLNWSRLTPTQPQSPAVSSPSKPKKLAASPINRKSTISPSNKSNEKSKSIKPNSQSIRVSPARASRFSPPINSSRQIRNHSSPKISPSNILLEIDQIQSNLDPFLPSNLPTAESPYSPSSPPSSISSQSSPRSDNNSLDWQPPASASSAASEADSEVSAVVESAKENEDVVGGQINSNNEVNSKSLEIPVSADSESESVVADSLDNPADPLSTRCAAAFDWLLRHLKSVDEPLYTPSWFTATDSDSLQSAEMHRYREIYLQLVQAWGEKKDKKMKEEKSRKIKEIEENATGNRKSIDGSAESLGLSSSSSPRVEEKKFDESSIDRSVDKETIHDSIAQLEIEVKNQQSTDIAKKNSIDSATSNNSIPNEFPPSDTRSTASAASSDFTPAPHQLQSLVNQFPSSFPTPIHQSSVPLSLHRPMEILEAAQSFLPPSLPPLQFSAGERFLILQRINSEYFLAQNLHTLQIGFVPARCFQSNSANFSRGISMDFNQFPDSPTSQLFQANAISVNSPMSTHSAPVQQFNQFPNINFQLSSTMRDHTNIPMNSNFNPQPVSSPNSQSIQSAAQVQPILSPAASMPIIPVERPEFEVSPIKAEKSNSITKNSESIPIHSDISIPIPIKSESVNPVAQTNSVQLSLDAIPPVAQISSIETPVANSEAPKPIIPESDSKAASADESVAPIAFSPENASQRKNSIPMISFVIPSVVDNADDPIADANKPVENSVAPEFVASAGKLRILPSKRRSLSHGEEIKFSLMIPKSEEKAIPAPAIVESPAEFKLDGQTIKTRSRNSSFRGTLPTSLAPPNETESISVSGQLLMEPDLAAESKPVRRNSFSRPKTAVAQRNRADRETKTAAPPVQAIIQPQTILLPGEPKLTPAEHLRFLHSLANFATLREKNPNLIKFGKRGRPHQTEVKIQDGFLYWNWESWKENSPSRKYINLATVKSMTRGRFSALLKAKTSPVIEQQCFTIVAADREINFQAKNNEEAAIWFNGLQSMVDLLKLIKAINEKENNENGEKKEAESKSSKSN